MRRARSELDEIVRRLSELAAFIGVSSGELSTFIKVLSKSDWASVEFRPFDGLEVEFDAVPGSIKLEITVRKENTTVIKEYKLPELLVERGFVDPPERPRRPRRRRKRPGAKGGRG